jgi:hypothetical protein
MELHNMADSEAAAPVAEMETPEAVAGVTPAEEPVADGLVFIGEVVAVGDLT